MRALLVLLAVAAASPLRADSSLPPAYWADRQLPDARQEARARALMEELRCLVCQGQSIADSDAEIAGDMRDLVRRRIAAGEIAHVAGNLGIAVGDRLALADQAAQFLHQRPSARFLARVG